MNEKWLNWHVFGMWILGETHKPDCTCSYCTDFRGTCGLVLPKCKASNAWRIFWWRSGDKRKNIRWTLPKWMCRKAQTA